MKEKKNIREKELFELLPETNRYRKSISVTRLDGAEDYGHDDSVRVYAHYVIVVLKGEIRININGCSYTLQENSLMDNLRVDHIRFISFSPDAEAYQLILTKEFLTETLQNKKPFPISYVTSLKNNPVLQLSPDETRDIARWLRRAMEDIARKNHFFQKELIQSSLVSFFMEIGNIVIQREKQNVFLPTVSRKDELVARFVGLLTLHCRTRHEVSFYAEELCITPQYLSRILKEQTGKTVHEFIRDSLLADAKMLLRTTSLSVQEIADNLHFADQASFGKFFKKYTGLTPIRFKRGREH